MPVYEHDTLCEFTVTEHDLQTQQLILVTFYVLGV